MLQTTLNTFTLFSDHLKPRSTQSTCLSKLAILKDLVHTLIVSDLEELVTTQNILHPNQKKSGSMEISPNAEHISAKKDKWLLSALRLSILENSSVARSATDL